MADVSLDLIQRMLQRSLDSTARIEVRLGEVIERLGRLERLTADLHGDFAGQSVRIDSLDTRLERVERRLDLIGPAPAAE